MRLFKHPHTIQTPRKCSLRSGNLWNILSKPHNFSEKRGRFSALPLKEPVKTTWDLCISFSFDGSLLAIPRSHWSKGDAPIRLLSLLLQQFRSKAKVLEDDQVNRCRGKRTAGLYDKGDGSEDMTKRKFVGRTKAGRNLLLLNWSDEYDGRGREWLQSIVVRRQ